LVGSTEKYNKWLEQVKQSKLVKRSWGFGAVECFCVWGAAWPQWVVETFIGSRGCFW
jgi:hypothetical protein